MGRKRELEQLIRPISLQFREEELFKGEDERLIGGGFDFESAHFWVC